MTAPIQLRYRKKHLEGCGHKPLTSSVISFTLTDPKVYKSQALAKISLWERPVAGGIGLWLHVSHADAARLDAITEDQSVSAAKGVTFGAGMTLRL